MRAARDLQVVVDEADRRRTPPSTSTAIQTYGLVRSAQSSVGTSAAARISSPPIVGVPAFGAMRCRTFLADHLADLELAQPAGSATARAPG